MRELVIEAAEEIIKEKTAKRISTKRIAMKGGINSGSLRLPELIPPFIAIKKPQNLQDFHLKLALSKSCCFLTLKIALA